MAYNRGYNPDALPAHAEPEQAAQLMSNGQPASGRHTSNSMSSSYNKPVPPPPQQAMQNMRWDDRDRDRDRERDRDRDRDRDRYGSRPSQSQIQSQGYQPPGPVPGAYGSSNPAPPPPSNYDYNRANDVRYNTSYNASANPPPPARHGSQSYQQPPPSRATFASPPPPATYGQGPAPAQGSHNRPPIPQQQRPPTVAPPPRDQNDRDALWPIFLQVDKDRSGQLSEEELRKALVNGDYTAFDIHTVKMMIRMFDTDRSGTINFDEFCGLWGFLAAWRGLFDRFDVDRSGTISLREFEDALVAFGYRLSPAFVGLLFNTYAKNVRGRGDDTGREKGLSFDLFVQACISLKRMTDVFKRYDEDRDGYITLSFEEFLTEILRQLK